MAKVKTPRDVKGANDLKILQKTTTSVLQSRIAPRSAANMKHCHSLTASRQIGRIDRQPWEPRVAEILQLAESHRFNRVNAIHHTLQHVQILLQEVSRREKKLQFTTDELAQTTNYLQTIMDSMVDILIATNSHGTIIEVNLAAERLSGFSREELIGHPFHSLFLEHDSAREGLSAVQADKVISDRELSLICKNAQIIPLMYNATLLEEARDSVSGILISARDMTEIKKAQKAQEMFAQELARANDDLEEFASVASHDLEEPLKKLMEYAEGLSSRYQDELDQQAQKVLQDMVKQTGNMRDLIKSVLSYAKVETGESHFSQTDSEVALHKAISNLSGGIEKAGAVVTNDPLPMVLANEAQLVRVFQNLLGNAVKYRDSSSKEVCQIHVSAERAEQSKVVLPEQVEQRGWLFCVWDNGIGIDTEFIDDIFNMFVRLHTETEYHGAGMGLAIARKIIKRHQGHIWVESKPGVGSSFYFLLPDSLA